MVYQFFIVHVIEVEVEGVFGENFCITLHLHFTDSKFVPRQLNMKQVTNVHKVTYGIYKRTH